MNQERRQHNAPGSNMDYDFFYEGLEKEQLLIQECTSCNRLCHPPSPMCPYCRSVGKLARRMSGRGVVYSYVVHRHPPLPGFDMPHPVGLVELEEGVRVVAGMEGTPIEQIEIGLPVVVEFYRRGDMATMRFRPAGGQAERN